MIDSEKLQSIVVGLVFGLGVLTAFQGAHLIRKRSRVWDNFGFNKNKDGPLIRENLDMTCYLSSL